MNEAPGQGTEIETEGQEIDIDKLVNIIENKNDKSSVAIEVHGQNYRALIDSGAEVSLVNRRIVENMPEKECLTSTQVKLAAATGDKIKVVGEIDMKFKLGKKVLIHTFIVVENIKRGIIIGRDCLHMHNMQLDFGKNRLILPGEVIPLEDDLYINSLVRVAQKKVLKPQTATVVWGKFKSHDPTKKKRIYCASAIDTGFIAQEPGLTVINSVAKVTKWKRIPLLICNNTGKTFCLNRGNVVARVEEVNGPLTTLTEALQTGEVTDTQPLDMVSIPDQYREELEKLLDRNADLFAATDTELGRTDAVEMTIDTGDHPPIKLKPYRTPLNQRPIVDKAIDDMLAAKIITPSHSSWSFPILLVNKKGTEDKRFCVDFRKLNQITRNYVYPLPHIDDVLASLGKSKVFSSLDLRSGYWQIGLSEQSKDRATFCCHRGLYQFEVMPFGLSNAPSVFQELMTHVLEGIQFATAYLDDIIIYSPTVQDHMEHLQVVFDRLRKFGLKMKMSKCKFMQKEINYLGFVVTTEGIRVDPGKVSAIRDLKPPVDVRQVRGFLGTVNYYRRFCPGFSEVALPLTALTKKHARFAWSDECQQAFDKLKQLLIEAPTLAFADQTLEYTLYTDASDGCIGAVLTQDQGQGEQPIHYLSHKLSDTQRRWPTIEKEAYAIVYALQKLDHYLHGAKFTIKTDHRPLKYLFSSEMKNKKIQMWSLSVSSHNCTIEYIKGKDNEQADFLSRLETDETGDQTVEITPGEVSVINSELW